MPPRRKRITVGLYGIPTMPLPPASTPTAIATVASAYFNAERVDEQYRHMCVQAGV